MPEKKTAHLGALPASRPKLTETDNSLAGQVDQALGLIGALQALRAIANDATAPSSDRARAGLALDNGALSAKQLAGMLNVTPNAVRRRAASAFGPKIGGRRWFGLAEVAKLLEAGHDH